MGGHFAAQGLDVTVDRGSGSQKTIELVATGTYELGYGDINSMIEYNVKNPGTPLIAVSRAMKTVIEQYGDRLAGHFVVATDTRIRIRPASGSS